MTVHFTEEMNRLWAMIKPWLNGCTLRKDAPKEITEAEEEYNRLFEEQYQYELKLNGYI